MAKEENLNKVLYKTLLYLLKVIPMVMAFISLLNTIVSYYGYDWQILAYLSSNSVLTLLFFYVASYVFRFCSYHRMFIHYNTSIWLLNIYDLYIGVPVDDFAMFQIYILIAGVFLFIILCLYVTNHKKLTTKNSR